MTYDFSNISASQLDILFNVNYGERVISPLIQRNVIDSLAITDAELSKISLLVLSVYQKKWDRLKSVYTIEYDKIHNYLDEYTESVTNSNTEETTGINTSSGTDRDVDTSTATRTDNLTKNGTVTGTKTDTESETDSVYGFNSASAVNAQASQNTLGRTSTDTSEIIDSGTQTHAISSDKLNTIAKEINNHVTINDSGTKSRTYKHQGNIGNLTTQDLLKQEIKLWEWNFIDTILSDVKELLTLPIYL